MIEFFALHGFAGSPDQFKRIEPFLPSCRFESPWLLGHGPSPWPLVDAPHANNIASYHSVYEQELKRLCSLLKPKNSSIKRYLLGYSLGARMSLGMLSQLQGEESNFFDGIILIAPNPGLREFPGSLSLEAQISARRQWDEMWAQRLESQGLIDFERAWSRQDLFRSQDQLDELTKASLRRQRLSHDPLGLAQAFRILGLGHMPDYWHLLKRLKLPVLYAVGSLDIKFLRICAEAAGQTRKARLVELPHCGHNPIIEGPKALAQSMNQWIA